MLNTTLKPFEKYPMWVKHPDHDKGNKEASRSQLAPMTVHNEEELKAALSRGYVAPEIDEKMFLDMQYQAYFARQIMAMLMGAVNAQDICMGVEAQFGQLLAELESLNDHPNRIDRRIEDTEARLRASIRRVTADLDRLKLRMKRAAPKKKPAAKPRKAKA